MTRAARQASPMGTPRDLLDTCPTVSVSEAAQILSVSRGQVYAMANTGELQSLRIGTRIVIPTDQLRSLIFGPQRNR